MTGPEFLERELHHRLEERRAYPARIVSLAGPSPKRIVAYAQRGSDQERSTKRSQWREQMLYFKHNAPTWERTMTQGYLAAGAHTSGG